MQRAFMKPSTPLQAVIAAVVVLGIAAAIGGTAAISGGQIQVGELGLDPFKADRNAVRQAYCRYAAGKVASAAENIRSVEMQQGDEATGVDPAAVLVFEDDEPHSIRCEFVPPHLVQDYTRLAAIMLDAEYLPMETLDNVNMALAGEEQAYRQ